MKKLLLSIIFFSIALPCLAMQPEIEPSLTQLPPEIRILIIQDLVQTKTITHNKVEVPSLNQAIKNINALSRVNRQFHAFVNDTTNTKLLIGMLARYHKKSPLYCASLLATPGACAWLNKLLQNNSNAIKAAQNLLFSRKKETINSFPFPLIITSFAHIKDNKGQTSLHWSTNECDDALTQKLIKYGAPVQAQDRQGLTPLHYAATCIDAETAMPLLDNNADVNDHHNPQQTSPLHSAALSGNWKITQELLQHGADVNAQDKSGNTALHIIAELAQSSSIEFRGIETAKILRAHHANTTLKNKEGKTALNIACKNGSCPLSIFLQENS